MSARVLSLLCSLSLCPCSSLVDRSNSLCISSWVIVWLLCKTGRPSLMKKSSRAQPCMHVAIMGEAQCMMIEASMLSANDHETSLVMCVYTTSLSHFTLIMAVKISHIFRPIIPFSCLLCVSL